MLPPLKEVIDGAAVEEDREITEVVWVVATEEVVGVTVWISSVMTSIVVSLEVVLTELVVEVEVVSSSVVDSEVNGQ